jgi:hypothetical protein
MNFAIIHGIITGQSCYLLIFVFFRLPLSEAHDLNMLPDGSIELHNVTSHDATTFTCLSVHNDNISTAIAQSYYLDVQGCFLKLFHVC